MKAKDIMSKDVITIKATATIEEIARTMLEFDISGVPVVDERGRMEGIVTEEDLLHKETNPRLPSVINVLGGLIYYDGVERFEADRKKLLAGRASEIMTEDVITVTEDTDTAEIAKLMLDHGIRAIPVVAGDDIVGIVSRADIIKTLLGKH